MHLMGVLGVKIVGQGIIPSQKQQANVSVEMVQLNDAVCDIEGEVAGDAENVFHD